MGHYSHNDSAWGVSWGIRDWLGSCPGPPLSLWSLDMPCTSETFLSHDRLEVKRLRGLSYLKWLTNFSLKFVLQADILCVTVFGDQRRWEGRGKVRALVAPWTSAESAVATPEPGPVAAVIRDAEATRALLAGLTPPGFWALSFLPSFTLMSWQLLPFLKDRYSFLSLCGLQKENRTRFYKHLEKCLNLDVSARFYVAAIL